MNVTHLIIGLGKGGAETMLYQIIKKSANKSIKYSVISFGASHYYEDKIAETGTPVYVFQLKRQPITSLIKAYRIIKKTDTLCCWMYHCNLIGYYLGKLAHVKKIIWSIRHSNLDPSLNKKTTLAIINKCAKLSKKVDLITYNGYESRRIHESIGFSKNNSIVLENGCDLDEYRFQPEARENIYNELGIPVDKKTVLSVTKYHPIKDIPTFINAFSILHSIMEDTVAIMCGSDVDYNNNELISLIDSLGLKCGTDIFLLGLRHDIPTLLSASDVYVLHSAGEAFPNTLIQAMSCSSLCISTDVGDASSILNKANCIVEKGNCESMAFKLKMMLNLSENEKNAIRISNRIIVQEKYNIDKIVCQYETNFT